MNVNALLIATVLSGGLVAVSSSLPGGSTDDTSATTSGDTTSGDGTTVPGGGFPGGVVDPNGALDENWFDEQGRLQTPIATDQSEAEDFAICDFVFGTPDEVAALFGIDDELVLIAPTALDNLGANGFRVGCVWQLADVAEAAPATYPVVEDASTAASSAADTAVDDTEERETGAGDEDEPTDPDPALAIAVYLNPSNEMLAEAEALPSTTADGEDEEWAVVVLADGRIGTVRYGGGFDDVGTRLDEADQDAYLEAASGRVVNGGV